MTPAPTSPASLPPPRRPALRREQHFGDRVMQCFAQRPGSVAQMLAEAVVRRGAGEALVCGAERLTWQQLDALCSRLAGGLQLQGVVAGDRVALLLDNGVPFVLTALACAKLGAIVVPLSARSQTPELAHALNDCGAVLVFVDRELEPRLPPVGETPALRRRCGVVEGPAECALAAWFADAPTMAAHAAAEDDVAAILYTSGTTGRPKGAMLTHLNIVHSAMHYELAMGLTETDRSMVCVPLSHVTGLIAQLATMLRCAGTLLLLPAFKAADFLALAAREGGTHTVMVPAMYKLCLLRADLRAHDLRAWRIGAFGGAPMPPATIAELALQLPGLILMNAYGATETTSPATIMPADAGPAHGDSVGRAVACGELAVMDASGRELPDGDSGEVWIKGPMVVAGYWNNAAATADSFVGGYWRSGDLGRLDADGFLCLHDRLKDVINRGGYKVYPAEVEAVLAHHPAVLEAAVIGTPCPVLGERVHAFVALRSSDSGSAGDADDADADAFARFSRARLSDYKVPESWTLQREPLPRNANGKLLKRMLRERLAGSLCAGPVA